VRFRDIDCNEWSGFGKNNVQELYGTPDDDRVHLFGTRISLPDEPGISSSPVSLYRLREPNHCTAFTDTPYNRIRTHLIREVRKIRKDMAVKKAGEKSGSGIVVRPEFA
jgi:hypothetical protein